jgi:hypothetical protein
MLHLDFARLPLHEQKLYKLVLAVIAASFVLGLLWVLLGFSDQRASADPEWQASVLPPAEDPLAQFATVSERPRWFSATGVQVVQPQEDPLKALEGKPESLRLTGLVNQGDKRYALFLPLIAPAGSIGKPAVRQLAEGDNLVGDWVIKTITHNQVQIQQDGETRTLKMYQPKTK